MVFITAIFILLQHLTSTTSQATTDHYHSKYNIRHSLLSDKAALLAFKSTVMFDSNNTLTDREEDANVCSFRGVRCDKHHHRVAQLLLPECGLIGPFSPFLSNLTGLRILDLSGNHFCGFIPSEFSHLRHLHHLRLDENNLTEALPSSFFHNCTSLRNVNLSHNFFTGKVPQEIGQSPNLWSLNLSNNLFSGQLPASLGNSSMYNLDVLTNYLSGELPSDSREAALTHISPIII